MNTIEQLIEVEVLNDPDLQVCQTFDEVLDVVRKQVGREILVPTRTPGFAPWTFTCPLSSSLVYRVAESIARCK